MKILSVRFIDGPNVYIHKPVLVANVKLEDLTERESFEFPGFTDRLLEAFPGLFEHHCAKGRPGGFVERLHGGTYFGHIAEHLAIELATICGLDVHFGKTLYAGQPGQYEIVIECKSFACQSYLLEQAVRLVQSLVKAEPIDVQAVIQEADRIHRQTSLGPSTQAIVDAAVLRDIPVRRMTSGSSLIQLGYGCKRKLVEATITQNTCAIAVDIACDKQLTKDLLAGAGIPVPLGGVAQTLDEALSWFRRIGRTVTIKPLNGNQGRGVSINLSDEVSVLHAFEIASKEASTPSSAVVVEEYIPGQNLRALVVREQLVAASIRLPANVTGDGVHSLRELISIKNEDPRRGIGHERPLSRIGVDDVVLETLRKRGRTLESVPAAGEVVLLRESANLSTGGDSVDVTEQLHPFYRQLSVRAARIIGLDVCGIDLLVPDPARPPGDAPCAVIEVNASPGIRMHEHPSVGKPRSVGQAIVNSLFPQGDNGRIPIVSVTGTNGKTTTTRLIAHALATSGKTVGMTTTGGVFINGQEVLHGDTTGPSSAQIVLSDPTVEVAVLETARGGIVRGGLAYDKANVAVITNITLDHVGQDGIESIEDLVHVKSLVAECVADDGWVVLNADDSELTRLAGRLSSRVAYFSLDGNNRTFRRHLMCGGVGYFVHQGWIMEARGNLTWQVSPVGEIPVTMNGTAGFQIENCLAAVAALRALGLPRQQVSFALSSFLPSHHNLGRCMLYQIPSGAHVVLDYGHNPDGFVKMGNWLRQVPHVRLIGVVGVPGDRADHVIRASADELAGVFDIFIVKEDDDKRGRQEGEVAALMRDQIAQKAPDKECHTVLDERGALRAALNMARPGDVVAVFYEHLEELISIVREAGGQERTHISSSFRAFAVPL